MLLHISFMDLPVLWGVTSGVAEKMLSHRAQTLSGFEWRLAESEINGSKEMGLLLGGCLVWKNNV